MKTGHFDLAPGLFDVEINKTLSHGERIDLGGLTLEVIHTPGYTPGHFPFFVSEFDLLFSGDIDY